MIQERNRCSYDIRVSEKAFRAEEGARKVARLEKKKFEQENKEEEEVKRLRDAQKVTIRQRTEVMKQTEEEKVLQWAACKRELT